MPWTPPSATWAWTGPPPSELITRSARRLGRCHERRDRRQVVRDLRPAAPAPTSWTSHPARRQRRARRVLDAYREQIAFVSEAGAKVILMASRALARVASGPEDYLHVYDTCSQEVDQPVILHWLGTMFDPALAGYWGSDDVARGHRDVPAADPRRTRTRSTG